MSIHIKCECGKQYSVKEEWAGKVVKCKSCSGKIRIPLPVNKNDDLSENDVLGFLQSDNHLDSLTNNESPEVKYYCIECSSPTNHGQQVCDSCLQKKTSIPQIQEEVSPKQSEKTIAKTSGNNQENTINIGPDLSHVFTFDFLIGRIPKNYSEFKKKRIPHKTAILFILFIALIIALSFGVSVVINIRAFLQGNELPDDSVATTKFLGQLILAIPAFFIFAGLTGKILDYFDQEPVGYIVLFITGIGPAYVALTLLLILLAVGLWVLVFLYGYLIGWVIEKVIMLIKKGSVSS